MQPMAGRLPRLNRRLWFGLLAATACLALSFVGIDPGEVRTILGQVKPIWLVAAALTVLLTAVAKGLRWRVLLLDDAGAGERAGRVPSTLRLTNIWLAGASLNLALPIPRSGDLVRANLVGEAGGGSKAHALGTVFAEKLLDVVMLAVCFLLLLPLMALPAELAARQGSVVGMAVLLIGGVTLLLWQRSRFLAAAQWGLAWLPGPWSKRLAGSLERGMDGLAALHKPGRLVGLATLTVGIWFVSTLTNYLVFLALDLPPSWVQSLFVLVVLQAGVAAPSTPGKIGLFQVLCRWALSVFGISAALGLAYGVLLYLVAPLLLMLLGALALVIEGWRNDRLRARLDTEMLRDC